MYPCKDGYVGVIAGPAHRWPAMAELMEEPRLNEERFTTLRGRQVNADELEALMEPWLMKNTKREIFEKAQEMGIAFAYVASPGGNLLLGASLGARLLREHRTPGSGRSGLSWSALPTRGCALPLGAGAPPGRTQQGKSIATASATPRRSWSGCGPADVI